MPFTLQSLMTEDHILLRAPADSWQDAIAVAASPLIADGSITSDYVTAMVHAVNTFGPYILLVPHLALAHAKPGDAVTRTAMSALVPAEPVFFGHHDHDPVTLIFCLASVDSESHLDALRSFVSIAGDPQLCERLVTAPDPTEFRKLLDTVQR